MNGKSWRIGALCLCLFFLGRVSPALAEDARDQPSLDLQRIWPFSLLAGSSPEEERDARTQAKVQWLDTHRLTSELARQEDWPTAAETCEAKNMRMIERPQLTLPVPVAEAFRRKELKPWAFVRYDVDTKGVAGSVTAINSSGDPDFDAAAVTAMNSAHFELLNGTDLAKGCIAYFSGADYIGAAPVRPGEKMETAAAQRPSTPRLNRKVILLPHRPIKDHSEEVKTEENPAHAKRWWYQNAQDQAVTGSHFVPGDDINCATLADRLARPVQCER